MVEKYVPSPEEIKRAKENLKEQDSGPNAQPTLEKISMNQGEAIAELLTKKEEFPALEKIVAQIQSAIVVESRLYELRGKFYKFTLIGVGESDTQELPLRDQNEIKALVRTALPLINEEIKRLLKLSGERVGWDVLGGLPEQMASIDRYDSVRPLTYFDIRRDEEQLTRAALEVGYFWRGQESAAKTLTGIEEGPPRVSR